MIMDDLIHLTGQEIQDLHDVILEGYPGLKGTRSDLSIDAVIGRIHFNLAYKSFDSVLEVGALYAEAIARGHVFNDGNKRTALASMLTFFDLNGVALNADSIELGKKIVELSDGKIMHTGLANWLRRYTS